MTEAAQSAVNKINPEVKARWVAALRSGEYTQGRDALRKDGKFCCLGVLCDLHDPKAWTGGVRILKYGGNDGMPPAFVNEWAGFAKSSVSGIALVPVIAIDGDERPVDGHNDAGRTFAEIADAIEAQL